MHPGGLSFVSEHAIITFAIAGLLALVLPRRWAVVAFVLAILNAVARVYLGAHNPLDVVGGAAVGLAIAAVLDLLLDVARDRAGSSRSSTLIDKASLARAAVSCSSRHSAFSRTLTSSRGHSRSSSARGIALGLSAGSGRRSRSMPMPFGQPATPLAESKERADRGHVPVPGRRRPPTPGGRHCDCDSISGQHRQRPFTAELMQEDLAKLDLLQHGPAARDAEQRVTERTGEPPQHAGGEQEVAERPGQPASTLSAR